LSSLSPLNNEERAVRESAILEFVKTHAGGENADLYASIIRTCCRMARDQVNRGDVKLVDRALQELRYAFKTFEPYTQTRKVSIFGSARTPEDHPDYIQAHKFAEMIRQAGWMVITGAGDGIMKAGHGGAGADASFGVAIALPFEQRTNSVIEGDKKLVNFKYFFTRKLVFTKEASAVVLFPGGFGTQDEGFEVLTLVQTGKAPMVPIVMVDAPGGTYWQHWRTYVKAELLHTGMISAEDMNLIKITDSAEAATQEILRFYHRFHSIRYVRDRLVIRMNSALPPGTLAELRRDYADIVEGGSIDEVSALAEESVEFPDKPRLVMKFNRRAHGRLRRLIDHINAVDAPAALVGAGR